MRKSRVQNCSECKSPYVRFRRDHPPARFCSVECKETYAKKRQPYEATQPARFFVSLIKDHLERTHQTSDLNAWFDGCGECERLAARYAESLNRAAFTES